MKKPQPQLLLSPQFLQFIKASASGRRLSASGKRITKGTITNYMYVHRLLIEFEEKTNSSIRILLLHRASMRTIQREKNYWSRFFLQFSKFLYQDKKFYDYYISSVFKAIKTFFIYLQQHKGYMVGTYYKSFRIPKQQATPVVLVPEQLRFLILNKEFDNSLSVYLRRARDIFVFGCTVGLRYSDLINLKKTNLVKTESETYLTIFTQKTGSEVKIPLPDYVMEIINRNKDKAGKYLLPRLSSTNFNLQVKKLAKKAGWDYSLQKNISYKGNMVELKTVEGRTWKFYEHITAHTMRRTAITILLILGVQENIVRKISGHAPGSKEFYRYVSIAQEYLNNEVKMAYSKLTETPILTSFKKTA